MINSRLTRLLIALWLAGWFCAAPLFATEEYAVSTKRGCVVCHVAPSGGGELTETGQGYETFLAEPESVDTDDGFKRAF